MTETCIWCR